MTRKIFWQDPYLIELATTIRSVAGNEITVAQTIFYAQSGGQESDHGTMNDHRVIYARKAGKEIIYTLEDGHGFEVGDPVRIVIDWTRRYQLMRLHFAAEVILALAVQHFAGIEKLGAHISQDKARIDFRWEGDISRIFPVLEYEAAKLIDADLAIESAFSDEEAEERFWKVEEFSKIPCGGTHLKRTGEIGRIALKRNNIGKGKERIEIFISPAFS